MNKADINKWVKIKFTRRGESLFVLYEDGHGKKVSRVGPDFRKVAFDSKTTLIIPVEVDTCLAKMLDAAPMERATARGTADVPLAIFVDTGRKRDVENLLFPEASASEFQLVQEIFGGILKGKIYQLAYHVGIAPKRPFTFPFRICVSGTMHEDIYSRFNQWRWYTESRHVQEYGIQLTSTENISRNAVRKLDILIASPGGDLPGKYEAVKFPALIILVGSTKDTQRSRLVKPATSVIVLNTIAPETTYSFLKDLLYSIIHDLSVPEAFKFALDQNEGPEVRNAVLFSSPPAGHSVRISDGLDAFKTIVNRSSKSMNPGDYEQFAKRLGADTGQRLMDAFSGSRNLSDYFHGVQRYTNNFLQESTGLAPIARDMHHFHSEKKPLIKEINGRLTRLVRDPDIFHELRKEQRRVVDATLDELNSFLQYGAKDVNSPLMPGEKYKLNITIGQRSWGSLMVGDIQPIDPLLPDPENETGHQLDIVVFPKDFKLNSPAIVIVTLPLAGASDTASFLLEAPLNTGTAQLRFAIFLGNNLLQAFILEGTIEEHYGYGAIQRITVKMDLSNSLKFTNLDAIGPRDLYLGLNSGSDGTHSLFIKDDAVANEIHGLDQQVLKDAQDTFAGLLEAAYFDRNDRQRFPALAPVGVDHEPFFEVVRGLSVAGRKYYSKVFQDSGKEFQVKLAGIKKSKDLSFQIARHEVNYAFPWQMMYDYSIPPNIAGGLSYPVCMGAALELEPEQRMRFACNEGQGCPHNPGLYTYCIEGFWGVRHQMEQLLTAERGEDTVTVIKTGANSIVYSNNLTDGPSKQLSATLAAYNPLLVRHDSDLMNILWNEQSRPATLVVFGHMQTDIITGEPAEPRILTFQKDTWPNPAIPLPPDKWLSHWLLDNKITNDLFWNGNPLPLVLLVTCYNSTMKIGSLNSIIKDFHTAGAAAIVGTECDIVSDLGALFIEELLESLYNEKISLAQAIQNFNKKRFLSYNPLAFVFTCFGNGDLKIETNDHN
jgi:hypothetical protein